MYTLQEWLQLDDRKVAEIVAQRASTAAVYLNGTRRWFLSQSKDWTDYAKVTGQAQRELSQLLYNQGIRTLIQPLMGYDLLERGSDYLQMAVKQGLAELATAGYRDWYFENEIRVTLYGNWLAVLTERGFSEVVKWLNEVVQETQRHNKHSLLVGVFGDESLDRILSIAKEVNGEDDLLTQYYGQSVGPVDLVVGSGQPAIWDLPLLNVNKASLYFLQAPTFCLDKEAVRHILYDHLYQRINDDALYDDLLMKEWRGFNILGLGQRTSKGWAAVL